MIVSNTFATKRELKPYFDFADENDIPVDVYRCTGEYQNVHNVPEEVVPERENGIEIVKEPEKKRYAGSRLYECDEYIYNDAGEVLTNFHLNYGLGIDVFFDRDRKYGVILSNNNCFLIEADLSYKQIASNVSYAGINYDGTKVYYSSSSTGLMLYDIETGEETLISDACYNACLSPDGKTIIYHDYAEKNRRVVVIGGIGKEETHYHHRFAGAVGGTDDHPAVHGFCHVVIQTTK